jgi:hypothetical protein
MDIKIEDEGDLVLDLDNDIALLSTKEEIRLLVIRALKTPKYYIGRYSSEDSQPFAVDENFGNLIYSRLSEPSTSETISNVNNDIKEALTFISPRVSLIETELSINNQLNTISILVRYSDQEGNQSLSIDL